MNSRNLSAANTKITIVLPANIQAIGIQCFLCAKNEQKCVISASPTILV